MNRIVEHRTHTVDEPTVVKSRVFILYGLDGIQGDLSALREDATKGSRRNS